MSALTGILLERGLIARIRSSRHRNRDRARCRLSAELPGSRQQPQFASTRRRDTAVGKLHPAWHARRVQPAGVHPASGRTQICLVPVLPPRSTAALSTREGREGSSGAQRFVLPRLFPLLQRLARRQSRVARIRETGQGDVSGGTHLILVVRRPDARPRRPRLRNPPLAATSFLEALSNTSRARVAAATWQRSGALNALRRNRLVHHLCPISISCVAIGLLGKKYIGNVSHYLVAGRELGTYAGIATLAATEIGTITFMYNGELGYRYGFAAFAAALISGHRHDHRGTYGSGRRAFSCSSADDRAGIFRAQIQPWTARFSPESWLRPGASSTWECSSRSKASSSPS